MRTIAKLALSGLVTVLPVALTLYAIWWLGSRTEAVLGGILQGVLPEDLYLPGAGLVLGFVLLILVGLVMRAVAVRRIARLLDRLIDRIPLVRTVYKSVGDLLSHFRKTGASSISQVVLVPCGQGSLRLLGLVTREEVPELDAGENEDPVVAVYIPMSYGIGGYTVLARRSTLAPVSMSVEEALRFAITAGAPSDAVRSET